MDLGEAWHQEYKGITMTLQLIDVGNIANDGTGDDLREAFIKINQNFEEIDLKDPDLTRAANIGATGEGVFAGTVNFELQFKKLVQGSNITLTSTNDQITIDALGGLQQLLVISDEGSLFLKDGDAITVSGGTGINTKFVGTNLIIENIASKLQTDNSPTLSATLNVNNFNIINVDTINTNQITGNLTGTVHNIDIRDINQYFDKYFDFGEFIPEVDNFFEWFFATLEVDLGTIQNPSTTTIDMGSIV
jgi:hypothetical protein